MHEPGPILASLRKGTTSELQGLAFRIFTHEALRCAYLHNFADLAPSILTSSYILAVSFAFPSQPLLHACKQNSSDGRKIGEPLN